MKTPEKIYLESIYPDNGVLPNGLNYSPSSNDIEYTRTDAFIEKMQLFLIDNLKEIPMGNGKMKIKAECSLEEFISNFENYIKGK